MYLKIKIMFRLNSLKNALDNYNKSLYVYKENNILVIHFKSFKNIIAIFV